MGALAAIRDFLLPWPAPPAPDAIAALSDRKALSDALMPIGRDWTYNWPWQDADGGIGLIGGYAASYAAMYERQPWVFIAVNKLARGIGRLPLKVYQRQGEARTRDRDSPLARLFARPYPMGSPFDLKAAIVGDLAVFGNAILIKQGSGPRGDRPAQALYPVCPLGWSIDADGDYRYRDPDNGGEKGYRREQIVHFRYWRPGRNAQGLSPLEPLRMTLAIEDAAQRLGVAAFKNGGNRPGTLSTDQVLTKDDQQRLSAEYNSRHAGVDNAYKTPVLFGGLKWQPTGGTMAESAVVDHRKLTRQEVAAAFDVPPPAIGITDDATFSNITEQGRWLVQHTYNVWTTLAEETLQVQLIDLVPEWADRYVEHDASEVLKGDPEKRFTGYAQALNAGWVTQNEVRAWENLPRVDDEDADRLHRPMNLTPVPPTPTEGGTPDARA